LTDVATTRPHGSTAEQHAAAVEAIRRAYAAIPAGQPVRLAKHTSNLFRFRAETTSHQLDAAPFSRVISVNAANRTAHVGGMTTYEDLVAATLRYGLMPLVVPELKTITLGGAVSGLGVESTSLQNGLPHESVIALEILTGDGRVVTATKDNEHAALYRGFPNSYGTLGYTLSLTIELQPVRPYVHLRHFAFTDLLPVDPRPEGGLSQHRRLPVAVGHRLVLVLARVRRAAPGCASVLAAPVSPLRRLPQAGRARP
jgi:FAD/FMN-containing dehydrogenase